MSRSGGEARKNSVGVPGAVRGAQVEEIVNVAAISVVDPQEIASYVQSRQPEAVAAKD
jgi:hypothetical protein